MKDESHRRLRGRQAIWGVVALVYLGSLLPGTVWAQAPNAYEGLAFLIGRWEIFHEDGTLNQSLNFEWGESQTYIDYFGTVYQQEEDREEVGFSGVIMWNPVEDNIKMLTAYTMYPGHLFIEEGEFLIEEAGQRVTRRFTVFYNEGIGLPWSDGQVAARGGSTLHFRQTFVKDGENGLRDIFLLKKEGTWIPPFDFMPPEGFRWKRAGSP